MNAFMDEARGINMVEQQIYFGALELTLHTPAEPRWKPEVMRFFAPVFPVKKQVRVDVEFCDELSAPAGRLIKETNAMKVYEGGMQERTYKPVYVVNQETALYSREEANRIYLQYLTRSNVWRNPNFSLLTHVHIEKLLLDVNAMVLHSCYTEYKGKAILFTAPSGTGKTTQANIWKRVYGSSIVNGDKCLLQQTADGFMASGFFLHGSAEECENRAMPIEAIVVVRQSKQDAVQELRPMQKLSLLYSEMTINGWDKASVEKAMGLLEQLIAGTRVIMLHCTQMDSAAKTLHRYLFGEE